MWENVNEQVLKAITTATATAPETEVKDVPSTEVKPLETVVTTTVVPETNKNVDIDKINEQLTNLNKALSIERAEKQALKADLDSVKPFYEKMKTAFVPEEQVVVAPEMSEKEKFNEWYQEEENKKLEIIQTEKIQNQIKSEIEALEKEWDGSDGKIKYDDVKLYKWQKDNGKTHLMPEEAFFLMNKDTILDWKSKQVVSKANNWITSEKPSWVSSEHTPTLNKPKTDQEIRNAVLEAMSSDGQ